MANDTSLVSTLNQIGKARVSQTLYLLPLGHARNWVWKLGKVKR